MTKATPQATNATVVENRGRDRDQLDSTFTRLEAPVSDVTQSLPSCGKDGHRVELDGQSHG